MGLQLQPEPCSVDLKAVHRTWTSSSNRPWLFTYLLTIFEGVYIVEENECPCEPLIRMGWAETVVFFFSLYLKVGRTERERAARSSLTASVPGSVKATGLPLSVLWLPVAWH